MRRNLLEFPKYCIDSIQTSAVSRFYLQLPTNLVGVYITYIHTFAILNYPPHFVPDSLEGKV